MCIDLRGSGRLGRILPALALGASLVCAAAPAAGPLAEPAAEASGRWRLAAEGETLHLSDAAGRRVKTFAAASLDGARRSRVSAVHFTPERRSFVVAFEVLPELWEISIDPHAEVIYHGLVHDFRMGEGVPEPGFLGARRTRLEQPLRDVVLDATGSYVIGRAADAADGRAVVQVVHLDVRRRIASFTVDGDPDLTRRELERRDGRELVRWPDRRGGAPFVLDVHALRLLPRS